MVLNFIWHKGAPLKVSLFSWRLLRNRFPNKDNLFRHGIIPLEYQLCVFGCGNTELAKHLFLHC